MQLLMVLALLAAPETSAPRAPVNDVAGREHDEPRLARDLGIPFDFGRPGPNNAITDVPGVEVGHATLLEGDAVRTGVTAVLPRGKGDDAMRPCFAGTF